MNLFEQVRQEHGVTYYRLAAQLGITPLKAARLCKGRGWPDDPMLLYRLFLLSGWSAAKFVEAIGKVAQ